MAEGEAAGWAAQGGGAGASSAGEWRASGAFRGGKVVLLVLGVLRLLAAVVSPDGNPTQLVGASLAAVLGGLMVARTFSWRVVADTEGVRVRSLFVTRHRSWDEIAEVGRRGRRCLCLVGRDDLPTLRFDLMRRELAESIVPALTAMLRDPTLRPPVGAAA
jgi:hypothetical protein